MNYRLIATVVLAVVLMCLVMGASGAITYAGIANTSKFSASQVWSQAFPTMESMKILDLTGDGQNDLFVQNAGAVGAFDANGGQLFMRNFPSPLVTTLGDTNADNVEDVVVFAPGNLVVLNGSGQELLNIPVQGISQPYRAAVVRFESGPQIVLGGESGQLIALDGRGPTLWTGATTIVDYIRGLDDVKVNGVTHLAAANHNGNIKVFDASGAELWTYDLGSALRRMRAYDLNGDGTGEILAGGDGNRLVMLDAATGRALFDKPLGQTIIEIRAAEIDGEPSSQEFVVGGKNGGAWAFRASGDQLWSASLSDRVTEIAGIDVDNDGLEEVVLGDESGAVNLFHGVAGARQSLTTRPSGITRIDAGRLTGSDQIAVADGSGVEVLSLRQTDAPIWYTPLLGGLCVSAIIAVAAWIIATIPQKPVLRVAVEDQSAEGLRARHRMLHESLADVERLRGANEMPADAYVARLRELRGELAESEAALQKAGVPVKVETFKCPHCGGTLPLGLDRCDYCGQVVIA